MRKARLFLLLQTCLCILSAALLIAAVISLYREGAAVQAGAPLVPIFSREALAACLHPIVPLLLAALGLTALGLLLGVRDEKGLGEAKGGRVENRAPGGRTARTLLLIAAIVLIAAGVCNGSARDVFGKAVKICTECVGLG